MKPMKNDWYKKIWTLDIQNQSWVEDTKKQLDFPYGEPLSEPIMEEGNTIRLYSPDEVENIFSKLGMSVCESYADFSGKPSSDNDIQLMVYSQKL